MRNHLHPLINLRTYWNESKPLDVRAGLVTDLGPCSGSSSRVNMGLKPWERMGENGAAQMLPSRIRYHMWVEKNGAALEEEIGDAIW